MKSNLLSIGFVGVFQSPVQVIPTLSAEFCKNLFDAPDDTFHGIGTDGFVIAQNNNHIPMVIVNTSRIMIKAPGETELSKYLEKLKKAFEDLKFSHDFLSFGINYEYQCLNLDSNSESWLWHHFIKSEKNGACNSLSFRFNLNDNELLNIKLDPRAGVRNGIFISVNHHHNMLLKGLPVTTQLQQLVKPSKMEVKNVLKNLIGEDEK